MQACISAIYCQTVALLGQQLSPTLVQGKLQAAMIPFEEAVQLVSFRSRVGGEATLQKAICLDSLVGSSVLLIHCGLFSDCSISWKLCVADGHAKRWDGWMVSEPQDSWLWCWCRGGTKRPCRCTSSSQGTPRRMWPRARSVCCLALLLETT